MNHLIYDKFYRFLCFYAYQISGNKTIAEDVAQDAFLAYFKNQHRVSDDVNAIKSYLYTAVRNQLLNQYKHEKVQQKYWEKTAYSEEDKISLEGTILYTELLIEIESLIVKLPATCQKVMRLSYFEGLSNVEILEKLDISINTLKTHRKRGIDFIKKHINREFYRIILHILIP